MAHHSNRTRRQSTRQHWIFKKPTNTLQNINTVISIVGVVISVVLAIWALKLTYKYGESKDQLDKLTTIATKQQSQLEKLQAILIETRKQTGISVSQVAELQNTNTKLLLQSKILSRQVNILSVEQRESNKLRTLARKASYMRLKNTALMVGELNTGGGGLVNNNPSPSLRLSAVKRVEALLDSELGNTYLLEHAEIAREWAEAYSWARIVAQSESTLDTDWYRAQVNLTTGVSTTIPRSVADVQKDKIQMFNLLVDKCFKLYFHVIKNMIWKHTTTGVF